MVLVYATSEHPSMKGLFPSAVSGRIGRCHRLGRVRKLCEDVRTCLTFPQGSIPRKSSFPRVCDIIADLFNIVGCIQTSPHFLRVGARPVFGVVLDVPRYLWWRSIQRLSGKPQTMWHKPQISLCSVQSYRYVHSRHRELHFTWPHGGALRSPGTANIMQGMWREQASAI